MHAAAGDRQAARDGRRSGATSSARRGAIAAIAMSIMPLIDVAPAVAQETVKVGVVSPNTGAAARYGAFAWRGVRAC